MARGVRRFLFVLSTDYISFDALNPTLESKAKSIFKYYDASNDIVFSPHLASLALQDKDIMVTIALAKALNLTPLKKIEN